MTREQMVTLLITKIEDVVNNTSIREFVPDPVDEDWDNFSDAQDQVWFMISRIPGALN